MIAVKCQEGQQASGAEVMSMKLYAEVSPSPTASSSWCGMPQLMVQSDVTLVDLIGPPISSSLAQLLEAQMVSSSSNKLTSDLAIREHSQVISADSAGHGSEQHNDSTVRSAAHLGQKKRKHQRRERFTSTENIEVISRGWGLQHLHK